MKPTRPSSFKPIREEGFTLTELLVVVLTIGILAVLLLPGLAGTKPNSQAFQCLENERQMVLAWQMYSDDNGGKLAPNYPQGTTGGSPSTQPTLNAQPNWVAGVMATTEVTNTAMLIDHVRYPNGAFLGPYIKTAAPFKCPADKSVSLIFGMKVPRCRSISMNNFLGAPSVPKDDGSSGQYPTYTKMTAIPGPSITFVTLDERADSINDGTFFVGVNDLFSIIDIPANYHNGAAGIGFADGHSEIHRWVSADLRLPIQAAPINNMPVTPYNWPDDYWMCQHALGLNNFPKEP
jgi:prepilin-type processing-associated H-X9-DG protein